MKKSTPLFWSTEQKSVNDLIPQETNPRKITNKQMSDLKKSLKKYNLVEIPAIDLDGTILAGHQRIKALQLLERGDELIDVRVPNRKLTEYESKQYLISSNKLGGDWDFDLLKEFEPDLLLDSGFVNFELNEFWDTSTYTEEDNFDVEKELKKITEPKTKLGDLIYLGNHKVLCGDSTEPDNLRRLLGDEQVSMIYSDPVYNINIDYSGGIGGKKDYGGNVNDTRSYREYEDFIRNSLDSALCVSSPETHVFYWCDQTYIGMFQELYREFDIENKRVCLWIKNNQNPVPSVAFNKVYEPCVYGVRGKPYLATKLTKFNEVMNKELSSGNNLISEIDSYTDIWTAKRISSNKYEHATSKPITLHEKAIKRCTQPFEIILDSFLGSGSTLLAGEMLDRKVYGCELEPAFCDLIIKRYERMTGKIARIEHAEGES